VVVEPGLVVVPGQAAQELEAGVAEIGAHKVSCRAGPSRAAIAAAAGFRVSSGASAASASGAAGTGAG
jgi:hypothetical protein